MIEFKDSYWIKSGFLSFGSRISTLLFGFGSFYFLIRHLPQDLFGVWALFLTITTILETSRNGLIQNALIKLLHTNLPEDSNKVITASWIINILFSIISYGMILLLFAFIDLPDYKHIQSMFLLYGITLVFQVPFSQFNYLQQARFSFSGIFWSNVTRQGLFFGSILIIYFQQIAVDLNQLVLIQSICILFGLITAFYKARPFINFQFKFDYRIAYETLNFGKYVMVTNLSSLIFKSTDQLLVGFLLNTKALALYNSAIRLSNLVEYPSTSIAEVVYPKSASKRGQEGESANKKYYEKSVGLTMIITLPIVIVMLIFADQIITVIAGPLYIESSAILRVTILYVLFTPFSRSFGASMDSSGRPHINMIVTLSIAGFNVLANYIGIKFFGIMGAAYATLFSLLLLNITSYLLMSKIFDVRMMNIYNYAKGYIGNILNLFR